MSGIDLAELLTQDLEPEAPSSELPEPVRRLRERFPLNEMVPHIQRIEHKPSERVRLRRLVERLRGEGLRVLGPEDYGALPQDADLALRGGFRQSGAAYGLTATTSGPQGESLLARTQELLQAESLPMVCTGELLRMVDTTVDELLWHELDMTPSWAKLELPFDQVQAWHAVLPDDVWRVRGWVEEGFTAAEAAPWLQAGVSYGPEAREWLALEAPGLTMERVAMLVHERVTPRQAQLTCRLWTA